MVLRLIILSAALLITFLVSFIVLLSHRIRIATRVVFFIICVGLMLWQLNIYIADVSSENLELLNTVIFFWPALSAIGFGAFIIMIDEDLVSLRLSAIIKRNAKFVSVLCLLFVSQLGLTISGRIFESVYKIPSGEVVFIRSIYYYVYMFNLLLSVLIIFSKLTGNYINKDKSDHREALKPIFITTVSTVLYGLITNALIPVVFSSQRLVSFGVLSIVIFSVGLSYSIVRYKFLNIQLVVARAATYLISIFIILAAFVLTVILVAGESVINSRELSKQLIFLILAMTGAITYPFVKKYFDKLTNNIFFRDSYNSQQLMDTLNDKFVNTLDLNQLLRDTGQLIQENIKVTHVTFYIYSTAYFKSRIVSTDPDNVNPKLLKLLAEEASGVNMKLLNIESETGKGEHPKLEVLLRQSGADIVSRLVSSNDYNIQGIGVMLIGPKQSGGFFNQQDSRTLEIISNELVIAIENVLKHEEIEQFNVTLQKSIDDATKELRQSNSKLLELDEAKDEFVTMASHQLRTPLTSIKGYISMVLEGDAGKITANQELMLKQAFVSSQRMVYLISDLLNVSRLKTGKFNIDAKPVDLVKVVYGEIQQMKDAAEVKKIRFVFKRPVKFPIVNLDELKTRQVIMNFMDNAIYYTPSGGKITVEISDKKDFIQCLIKDTGIGVPNDQRDKLFTKFYRADNARKVRPDGTGLGLFMAKKVIEAQNGKIIFESKMGKGSTFGFTLPISDKVNKS